VGPDRRFLAKPDPGRQYQCYWAWRGIGSLANAIGPGDRPLIEAVELDGNPEYEIVDGWGRLLSFAALVLEGLTFFPFESFLASRTHPDDR